MAVFRRRRRARYTKPTTETPPAAANDTVAGSADVTRRIVFRYQAAKPNARDFGRWSRKERALARFPGDFRKALISKRTGKCYSYLPTRPSRSSIWGIPDYGSW